MIFSRAGTTTFRIATYVHGRCVHRVFFSFSFWYRTTTRSAHTTLPPQKRKSFLAVCGYCGEHKSSAYREYPRASPHLSPSPSPIAGPDEKNTAVLLSTCAAVRVPVSFCATSNARNFVTAGSARRFGQRFCAQGTNNKWKKKRTSVYDCVFVVIPWRVVSIKNANESRGFAKTSKNIRYPMNAYVGVCRCTAA